MIKITHHKLFCIALCAAALPMICAGKSSAQDSSPAPVTFAKLPATSGDQPERVGAARASDFLNSIGADSGIDSRGETLAKTIECATYLGIRWFRAGIEGDMPLQTFETAYNVAGIRFDWCIGSGGSDVDKLISTAHTLQQKAPGALLSFEGPNEPNNWGITYLGEKGGGSSGTWLPVAKLQADIYQRVKSDPLLKKIPVWGISENGAEDDNVGLQFLTIPQGTQCLMPDGTRFADYANVHNYIFHPNSPGLDDNKTWNAADPTPACKVDGLYGEYGLTWGRHYSGYSPQQLLTLPRVTTETGEAIGGVVTERIHALNLMSMYLDQYKRGWSYTAVYLLRDRVDESGNQEFGFYKPDYSPRLAALYLHNLTTILADTAHKTAPTTLAYTVHDEPVTVHDMLLQKSNGAFALVIWDEKVSGTDTVSLTFGGRRKALQIYDPTVGISQIGSLANVQNLRLTLSDHPAILVIPAS